MYAIKNQNKVKNILYENLKSASALQLVELLQNYTSHGIF